MSANSEQMWGLGQQLYRSDDGKSWETLTSYKIGIGDWRGHTKCWPFRPTTPASWWWPTRWGLAVDGRRAYLGQPEPAFAEPSVERIIATPSGGHSAQILIENQAVLELLPGSTLWRPRPSILPQSDALKKQDYSGKVHANITAYGESSDTRQVYAGSEDGRIWRSVDGGVRFEVAGALPAVGGHKVERLFVDPANPRVALAMLNGEGPHLSFAPSTAEVIGTRWIPPACRMPRPTQ